METNETLYSRVREITVECLTKPYWQKKNIPLIVNSFTSIAPYATSAHISPKHPAFTKEYMTTLPPRSVGVMPKRRRRPGEAPNEVFLDYVEERWPGFLRIFTDGSKQNQQVGAAFYDATHNYKAIFKLPSWASVYSAELVGLLEALKYGQELSATKITIFTDNKSAILKVKNFEVKPTTNHLILSIREMLYSMVAIGKEVCLVWIKGHSGIFGNEMADALAKEAARLATHSTFELPPRDMGSLTKQWLREKWKRKYLLPQPAGERFKFIQPGIPRAPWFVGGTLSKDMVKSICRMRSGHAMCGPTRLKMGITESAQCERCLAEIEDVHHIIMECPTLARRRRLMFDQISAEKIIHHPFNLPHLLQCRNVNIYSHIYNFLSDCNVNL
ncbi:hypothetical protein GE061_014593 [Apolygus lucorum]|uniref:ribonuclease H n=1 Tax=Apolygus lucorum TaxID=248454 RepID=A0A8S9XKP9_APOLU|nr:hypothetical protein GE061_014593 [Apolygus lucorum]